MTASVAEQDKQRSTGDWLTGTLVRSIGLAGAFGAAYFLLGYFVILGMRAAGLAIFWPSSGLATGVLIVLGPRARWPVSAGIVVAVVILECFVRDDRTVWIALADSLCDAAEPLIVAGLVRRYVGKHFTLDRVRNVLGLFIAILAGTLVSSIAAGIASVTIFSPEPPFLNIWWIWFSSGVVSEVAVAPFVIGIAAALREPLPRSELIAGGLVLVALAATTAIVIWLPRIWVTVLPGVLILPMLLWLTARFQPIFAAAGVLLSSLIVVWAAIYGIGHFAYTGSPASDRIT
jgi:integral membrane sensor domain MASE1